MHAGFLELENAKMSKSLGNVVRLRDALAKVDGEALRLFFLSSHYRNGLAFSDEALADAEKRMEYFYETLQRVDERLGGREVKPGPLHGDPDAHLRAFEEAMDDDFNTAGALAALSGLFGQLNEFLDRPPVQDRAMVIRSLARLRAVVPTMGGVLGILAHPPAAWLERRRDRLVHQRGLDRAAHPRPHRRARRGPPAEGLRALGRPPRRAARDGRRAPGRTLRDAVESSLLNGATM